MGSQLSDIYSSGSFSSRCRFWVPNQRVSTPVVLFSYGVDSGFPISGSPLQWFFFLTVLVLVRFSNPGCEYDGAIVLENLAGRLLLVK